MEVDFKARRLDNNKWVTGWFTKKQNGSFIVSVSPVVCPNFEKEYSFINSNV